VDKSKIPPFSSSNGFKHPEKPIYEKRGAATMATPHLFMRMRINHVEFANLYARADNIGDVCAAEVTVDGVRTLLVSVYINPNTSTDDIECFLLYNLMAYSPKFCAMWPRLQNTACTRLHQSKHIHRRHRMFPTLQPDGLFAKDLYSVPETQTIDLLQHAHHSHR
jgi:hypothetical protein